ncbi:unnamed protein product [Cercospora beticola]|nr:unnamed protein product [Cercospora beticola]
MDSLLSATASMSRGATAEKMSGAMWDDDELTSSTSNRSPSPTSSHTLSPASSRTLSPASSRKLTLTLSDKISPPPAGTRKLTWSVEMERDLLLAAAFGNIEDMEDCYTGLMEGFAKNYGVTVTEKQLHARFELLRMTRFATMSRLNLPLPAGPRPKFSKAEFDRAEFESTAAPEAQQDDDDEESDFKQSDSEMEDEESRDQASSEQDEQSDLEIEDEDGLEQMSSDEDEWPDTEIQVEVGGQLYPARRPHGLDPVEFLKAALEFQPRESLDQASSDEDEQSDSGIEDEDSPEQIDMEIVAELGGRLYRARKPHGLGPVEFLKAALEFQARVDRWEGI